MKIAKTIRSLDVEVEKKEHASEIVPASERRSSLTMGLLWITMVTSFPTVLMGFQWCKEGLTLSQVIICSALSCFMLLLYAVPATYLGAKTGQGYILLSRGVFGRLGTYLVTFNLIWVFIAWYSVTALFLADGLKGLYQIPLPVMWLAAGLALLMAFNNFFGFAGVANFARFLAAPALIAWVGYSFFKATAACPATVFTEIPHKPLTFALTTVSAFVIGYATWGNESDYWRYSKPKINLIVIPLVISLLIGQIIFPITGWMLAHMSGVTEYAAATAFMNQYSFGGIPFIAAAVLAVTYFAVNDSNLYGSINALENIRPMAHRTAVAFLAIVGAAVAAWLSLSGAARAIESIASLNCIILPIPTIIVFTEWFLRKSIIGSETNFERIYKLSELPAIRWPAALAFIIGSTTGIATSGLIPGTEAWHVGVFSVQSWLASIVVYVPLRLLEYKQQLAYERLALERLLAINPLIGAADSDTSNNDAITKK